MALFQELAAEVKAAFQDDLEARDVVVTRRAAPTHDLVEGTVTPGATSTSTMPALILPASGGTLEAFDVRFMDGVRESSNVRFALLAADGAAFRPEPNDTADLYGDGREWLVMGCTPISPDGTDVVYAAGFRLP